MAKLSLFFCLFAILLFSPSALAKPKVFNGTAATLGNTLITIRDAYIYRALSRFREKQSPAVLIESGDVLKKTVQKVAFEEMVYLELKSFEFQGVAKSEAEKVVKERSLKHHDWKDISKTFEVSENDLLDRLHKTLLVEKFLQRKVDTLSPVITDSEVEKYFQAHQSRFKGNTLQELKPNITVLLKKEHVQRGLEEWIRFLKEKYNLVTLIGD